MQETRVQALGQEEPLEKGMSTHSGILVLGNPMDRGAWRATVCGVLRHRTQLSAYHTVGLTRTFALVFP